MIHHSLEKTWRPQFLPKTLMSAFWTVRLEPGIHWSLWMGEKKGAPWSAFADCRSLKNRRGVFKEKETTRYLMRRPLDARSYICLKSEAGCLQIGQMKSDGSSSPS